MRSHIRFYSSSAETSNRRGSRLGFTLLELLMVIVIISILMALAMGAYQSVMSNVKVAGVKVEIDQMSGALADFKAKFGFYPPSDITLHVNSNGWNSDPRSRAIIRRMFPQFNFTGSGGGSWTQSRRVVAGETLVFFLGGVTDDSGQSLIGFSNNPALPFSKAGSNRIGPFFEFDSGRLIDVNNNKFPAYVSSLSGQTLPYMYLSAYNGKGYRYVNELPNTGGLKDVYRKGVSEDTNFDGKLDPGEDTNGNSKLDIPAAWNAKTFQIISPGFDDKYGNGGKFDVGTADLDLDEAERDNITNFHGGMLSP